MRKRASIRHMTNRFSVIIPTLNEENVIHKCIVHLHLLAPEAEIIVADGGSLDDTVKIAREEGAIVCYSTTGRGTQCNAGAALANREILMFLHADTELPQEAFTVLDSYFNQEQVRVGSFRLSFDVRHWLLEFFSKPSRFSLPISHFGDQCIVMRRSLFSELGGFPDWPLFEDLSLITRARKRTRIYRFPMAVTTSARRFLQNGILRQQLLNVGYIIQYLLGTSPHKLAAKYQRKANKIPGVSLGMFVRFPDTGKAKTRLAVSVGKESAAALYRSFAESAFQEFKKIPEKARLYIFPADGNETRRIRHWAGPGFYYVPQVQGHLGQRLEHAFSTLFDHGAEKAVITASDTPDLTADIITQALQALDTHNVVIGPSHDGGYYLIGTNKMQYKLFQNISWSTERVVKQTLAIVNALGLSCHLLPNLIDIDTADDLRLWQKRNAGTQG